MAAILAIVAQAVSLIPGLIAAGLAVEGLVEAIVKAINSGSTDPTADVWQAVDAAIAANTAKLNTDPA